MGAGISCSAASETPSSSSPSLGDIPERCISSILMHFDPPEICKLALLSRTFHGASSADFVWETKLPSNYKYLVRKVLEQNPEKLHKKEIYTRLCQPNCFDNGTKETWLDKGSGQVCVSISAKAMKITGIDDRRYWNQIPTEESRKEIQWVVDDIQSMLRMFKIDEVYHVGRACNGVAHRLAKLALQESNYVIWRNCLPLCLEGFMN